MKSTTTQTPNTPHIDLITLLDCYHISHTNASSELKSCVWNLSKARRQKGGFHISNPYTALDIREELRARAKLECTSLKCMGHDHDGDEPDLLDDGGEKDAATNTTTKDQEEAAECFILHLDGIPNPKNKQIKEDMKPIESDHSNLGIRQRRKGNESKQETTDNVWTQEDVLWEEDDDKRLYNIDPLELFGAFPPKDLKVAQAKARESLKQYIESANMATKILNLTSSLRTDQDC